MRHILCCLAICLSLLPMRSWGQTTSLSGNRIQSGWTNVCTAGGTTNAYTCTLANIGSYRTGTRYTFVANAANTGAATWNLNGLGAKSIVKLVGSITTPLLANDIRTGQLVDLMYDGTNLQMLSPPGTVDLATGHVGLLAVPNGGLGVGTITGLLQGNGTAAVTAISNSTTVGQALRVTGSNTYAWGALDLANANAVTGILPASNGGTANAFFAVTGPASTLKTMTFPNANATITQTIASGTLALATSTIASGACTSAQTATATGTLTTDVVMASFNGDVTGVTGYGPVTTGTLRIDVYPTTNTVNAKVCNATAAFITPGAVTLNYRVVR